MWQQYKKTLFGMQVMIGLVTTGVLLWSHAWDLAALFFITMQVGAVFGAIWGNRLRNKLERNAGQGALR
jgi:MFS-type transporter involved in bile tolerance (Atg22 family)